MILSETIAAYVVQVCLGCCCASFFRLMLSESTQAVNDAIPVYGARCSSRLLLAKRSESAAAPSFAKEIIGSRPYQGQFRGANM